MNTTINAMLDRRSCRKYQEKMVPKEVIEQIITAGTYAASGMGKQSGLIIAVTDKKLRDQLSEMNRKIGGWGQEVDPFYGAPAVLIVLADKSRPTHVYDGALVMGNLMLAASSLGVGSCWIHRAKEEFESGEGKKILADLGVKGEYEGIGHCILGYRAGEKQDAAPRKEGWAVWAE
jgi:nitroreductase